MYFFRPIDPAPTRRKSPPVSTSMVHISPPRSPETSFSRWNIFQKLLYKWKIIGVSFDKNIFTKKKCILDTGKSLSEALLFAEHGENMVYKNCSECQKQCTQHVLPRFELGFLMYWTCNSMNNLSSYCGLVDAKISASEKDLPVICFQ